MVEKETSNLKKRKVKKILLVAVIALVASILLISGSMAYFKKVIQGNQKYVITANDVILELNETSESISLGNMIPQTDEDGKQNDSYTFSLKNISKSTPYRYTIYLEEDDIPSGYTRVSNEFIKYYFYNNKSKVIKSGSLSDLSVDENGIILETSSIGGADTYNYTLRFWVDYDATQEDVAGKAFAVKLNIIAELGCGEELVENEPNEPELTSGMIAVTYNETDNTWEKADTSTNDWYDYSNQIWANAVTVTESTRTTYMAADAGTPISIDDINTMWVWIPRYSYTIKKPYGRGSALSCNNFSDVESASEYPTCLIATEYTDEARTAALNICKFEITEENKNVNTEEECLEYMQTGNYETFEDIIDEMFLQNMLYKDEMYESEEIKSQTLAWCEATTEEQCISGVYGSVFGATTFKDMIFIAAIMGGIDASGYTIDLVLELEKNKIAEVASSPGEIDINFISSDKKDVGTGQCMECAENWVTPEGFTFGEENISGFWMGKFETSTLEECTAADSSINTACDLTTLTPQIKPGVTSWRGARVSTFFEASRLMQSSDDTLTYNADTYGFDAVGTGTMDTHMLKNTEWGIVAMLSQSKYGKYGNTNYTEFNKEVYQNKSSDYITGMSNGTPSSSTTTNPQITYDTPDTGYGASTTGTIYGVYDMSGGAYEYVMGNYNNYSGGTSYNSGFCGTNGPTDGTCREWPDTKYVDVYTSNIAPSAYKFGDGTYETSGWYNDNMYFVGSINPWFGRGGSYFNSTNAGVFNSNDSSGKSNVSNGVRFVIKP